ncbi:uncharacterized protein [Euwallacea fornicatus]|uniref:uncharacterized protein n=1 Tax=Euwallacea fornicatus TaxID=995702 RepID=UPI00338D4A23
MDVSFTNVLEGARQYFQGLPTASAAAGPYFQQNVHHERSQQNPQQQQQQQQQQQPQQPQHQVQQHGHGPPQQQGYYQQSNEHYAAESANASASSSSHWIQQHSPSEGSRTPTRERTPLQQRPSSLSSSGSRPPSHSSLPYQEAPRQYHNAYPPPQQPNQDHHSMAHASQSTFQFTRPQSRDLHPSQQYHQQPNVGSSNYQPSANPHLSRPSSREQLTTMAPYQQPARPPVPSQSQYAYHQNRAYYGTAQAQQIQSAQHSYYGGNKQSSSVPMQASAALKPSNGQYHGEQTPYRATHNLPPIAAVSSYHSNKAKDPVKSALPRPKVPFPSSYPSHTPTIQYGKTVIRSESYNPPVSSATNYNQFSSYNQNSRQASTVITQTYTNVIMTSTNTIPNNNQSHYSSQQKLLNVVKSEPNQNVSYLKPNSVRSEVLNVPANPSVIKQRKESPLDLSVKTVKSSADSTEGEASRNRYGPNKSLSHSYPTLDVSTIERSFNQRSQPPTVTAPKVEFQPNFNLSASSRHSNTWTASKPVDEQSMRRYQESVIASHMKQPSPIQQPEYLYKNKYPSSVPNTRQFMPQTDGLTAKRPGQVESPAIPAKLAKVDNWMESINLQIEEKFTSHYRQQQLQAQHHQIQQQRTQSVVQQHSKAVGQVPVNGTTPYNYYNQKSAYNTQEMSFGKAPNVQPKVSHQNYVPSSSHSYPGYFNHPGKPSQYLYVNPVAKFSNSTQSLAPAVKQNAPSGADKRVLSLLRNSIEIKEQKKIEQQKAQDLNQLSDVQHPSTDVTAPLQPKPGIDRNNVSPFTPISVPDPNVCKMPPKVIPSSEMAITKLSNEESTVIMNSNLNNDYDGLAAFLAARIRTKGELKELAQNHTNAARDARIQAFLEDAIKSPNRPNMHLPPSANVSSGPPKLIKEKPSVFPPRKRLFSKNEEDPGKHEDIPGREKSMRSSSETSVFDFPDSEDENEMPVLERQTLGAMRKDRRNSLKNSTSLLSLETETKIEPFERSLSPEDDIFRSICDKFLEQLKTKPAKRVRRTPLEVEVKTEAVREDAIEAVKIKVEVEDEPIERISNEELLKVEAVEAENCATPLTKNVIQSDSDLSESEIKPGGCMIVRNKHRVVRKIVSSSDSSDNEKESPKNVKLETSEITADLTETKSEGKVVESSETEKTPSKPVDAISIIRPAKKPLFGDGSGFYPGWEEGVYKYKRSLRMPPSLIPTTRPSNRLSTSLPDLDPCPQSPTASITTETELKESLIGTKKSFKSEPVDSDSESISGFNVFSKTNYDSEGSSSIRSLPNTRNENISILDKLLEKCGGRRKRNKRKDDHSPKIIPKAENAVELLATPTPSVEFSEKSPEKSKRLSAPVLSTTSAVLPFRKDTVNHFKDAFINSGNNILGMHDKFTTIVLSSRTRKETRAMKQRATIKEVFGEDRPASAPPDTCVSEAKKEVMLQLEPFSKNLEEILIKKEKTDLALDQTNRSNNNNNQQHFDNSLELSAKIKKEVLEEEEEEEEEENKKLIDLVVKKDPDACSETMSLDSEEAMMTGRRKNKYGKIRRKFSSGFDYIRKKKKTKKEEFDSASIERKKKRVVPAKAPESIDDIQKEIKSWVLNKGIGESHLHRAARLGYVDVTAYCLDKMDCPPGPKDNAGYTPLHEACARGQLEIAKLLLKYGANVHEAAKGGIRPLHEAIENGFMEIVRLLLSYGADPTLATYAGLTPISLASDDNTRKFLKDHLSDKAGEGGTPWPFYGPASCFDPGDWGYDVFEDTPLEDCDRELEDIEIDMSEALLPNLYTLRGDPPADRWILLQDLSHFLKIKSRDALLKQISTPTSPSLKVSPKSVIKELKMTDFLEQAHCCQFLNMGEKLNTRASKIALVKYTDRVKELLGIESALIVAR